MQVIESTPPAGPSPSQMEYFLPLKPPAHTRIKQIWSIGGGKGGIGKSLIASNFAISLSRLGYKVIAIDLDLGGANLHTSLGVDLPKQSLNDFITNREPSLSACVAPTEIPNVELISGAQDSLDIANLPHLAKTHFLNAIWELNADYLIFDLGAGTNLNTLDFFAFSDVGFIVLLPEPTSIENAYRFIKGVYYRRIKLNPEFAQIRSLVDQVMDPKNNSKIITPSDLYREASKTSLELAVKLKNEIEKFQPKLIVNQTRTQTDIEIGRSVKTVCKRYFGIDMDYLGNLDYDPFVWQAVRKKRPLLLEFPNSKFSISLEQMTHQMIHKSSDLRSS